MLARFACVDRGAGVCCCDGALVDADFNFAGALLSCVAFRFASTLASSPVALRGPRRERMLGRGSSGTSSGGAAKSTAAASSSMSMMPRPRRARALEALALAPPPAAACCAATAPNAPPPAPRPRPATGSRGAGRRSRGVPGPRQDLDPRVAGRHEPVVLPHRLPARVDRQTEPGCLDPAPEVGPPP